jgi:hypothetical protein
MARLSFFASLISRLTQRAAPAPALPPLTGPATDSPVIAPDIAIAWGTRVSGAFRRKVIEIGHRLEMDPNHLMAIMAFETGRSFDPAVTNHTGSGATGLIQFMPATARNLGTTTAALAAMSALDQLDYVERYLVPYAARMHDLPSAYMAVLFPRAVDKEPGYVLFRKGSKAYKLNRGLDTNGNGYVTKTEAAAKVSVLLAEGLKPGLIG